MSQVVPEISGRNYDVPDRIRALLLSKLEPLEEKLFDDVISVRAVLEVKKYRHICEIVIIGKEHDVKAVQESGQSMTEAVHAAIDHVRRQARKHRERIRDHHRGEEAPLPETT